MKESSGAEVEQSLSPELVRQVAERVYALWLKDLKVMRERQRWTSGGRSQRQVRRR